MTLREDADYIIKNVLTKCNPRSAVMQLLKKIKIEKSNRIIAIAIGKCAWDMAKATEDYLGDRIRSGVVITKYNHLRGTLTHFDCYEAGHPITDQNCIDATERVIEAVRELSVNDIVLFLVSGGGSALFEKPLVPLTELNGICQQLLNCGANIVEINTIRKRLSAVKGGRFIEMCLPARIVNVVLSDVIGDQLDMIASGPTCKDTSTCTEAMAIIKKYDLKLSKEALQWIQFETPRGFENTETYVVGNVKLLCRMAESELKKLGYDTMIITDCLTCEAREAGRFLSAIARFHAESGEKKAFITGGETIVTLQGHGKGGRNQELALAAADGISGLENVAIFSVGSDGTDGITDAAGGFVDGSTKPTLEKLGININKILKDNDSYTALSAFGGLIVTGATGTNLNDFQVVLIRKAGSVS